MEPHACCCSDGVNRLQTHMYHCLQMFAVKSGHCFCFLYTAALLDVLPCLGIHMRRLRAS